MARTVHRSPSPLHLLAFHPFLPHPPSLSPFLSASVSLPPTCHPPSQPPCLLRHFSFSPSPLLPLNVQPPVSSLSYPSLFLSPPPVLLFFSSSCSSLQARRSSPRRHRPPPPPPPPPPHPPFSRLHLTLRYVTLRYVTLHYVCTYVPPTRSLAR